MTFLCSSNIYLFILACATSKVHITCHTAHQQQPQCTHDDDDDFNRTTTLAPSNHHIHGDDNDLKRWRTLGSLTKKRNGPNDARCIVWAISKFFFYSLFYLFITTKCYI